MDDQLEKAKRITSGQGFMGRLVSILMRLFFGKQQAGQFSQMMGQANQQLNAHGTQQNLRAIGKPAKAVVKKVEETGMFMNQNPVARLTLEVRPEFGEPYETMVQSAVSIVNIPRVNDEIDVLYNPDNPNEVALA